MKGGKTSLQTAGEQPRAAYISTRRSNLRKNLRLPHPGEAVLPKFIHDEARSVLQVLDRDAVRKSGSRGGQGLN